VGEPPYAEREITIDPDPPKVGQGAQICAELHNYAAVDQAVDLTLYAADFGIGIPFQEVGQLPDVVIPANSTVKRCLPWIPPPGSLHRCLQIRIQQQGYEDITSQRNIDLRPPIKTGEATIERVIQVGNPKGETKKVEVDVKTVGFSPEWTVALGWEEATLEPGQVMSNTIQIIPPAAGSAASLPGQSQVVAVEAYIDDELIGGVQFEFEKHRIYLPVILK
jgi:hypothetical protein